MDSDLKLLVHPPTTPMHRYGDITCRLLGFRTVFSVRLSIQVVNPGDGDRLSFSRSSMACCHCKIGSILEPVCQEEPKCLLHFCGIITYGKR